MPARESYTQAPKYCACRKICTKSSKVPRQPKHSKVLRLSRKVSLPNSKSSKVLDLPRNPTLTRLRHASKTSTALWRQNDVDQFHMFQARQNEPIVNENRVGANTIARLPSRTPQSDHPGSQIPMARQREHAAFQNTAPAQRNNTSSVEKLRFAHRVNENSPCRSIKNTLPRRILMAHAHRLTADGCGRLRTVANGCERLRTVANSGATPREHGLHPQTPTCKREPFATHSGKRMVLPCWHGPSIRIFSRRRF